MRRFMAVVAAVLALWAVPVLADPTLPPGLQKMKDDGIAFDFIGHAFGLDGWRVFSKEGNASYAYTTPEGGILLGVLLDPSGKNVTGAQLKALKDIKNGGQGALPGAEQATAASARAEKLYAEVEQASWAAAGASTAPYLYMFINTECDHCYALWNDVQDAVQGGKLQVRLVPFGKVTANREGGAALLSVDDPLIAWRNHVADDDAALSPKKIKPGTLAKVDANTELFARWGLKGPPFVIFRRPADGQVMVVAGRPSNMMLLLADLLKG
jgi:hypothetical protein